MKNLHTFFWLAESIAVNPYKVGNWTSIQVVFELIEPVMKLIGLPLDREHSMYTAIWASTNKKLIRQSIPDEVMIDYCNCFNSNKYTNLGGDAMHIHGKYGLIVKEFCSYKEDDPDIRVFDVTKESAKELNPYISRYHGHSRQIYIKGSNELSEDKTILSNQAKFFLTCCIGNDVLWNGRNYKFKVLQYSTKQKQEEIQDLINRQLSWTDPLCKLYNLSPDHQIVNLVRETMLSKEPNEYE